MINEDEDEPTAPKALEGLLVADFSRALAGPYLTMLLGDLGATVIKVESPEGDQTRGWGPPWDEDESTYFKSVNRNKRSIQLDLTDPADRAIAAELARRSDVLVENLMQGRMKPFGLDYEEVSTRNPRVIYCSISGFGSSQKAAALPGFDLVAQAVSGLMSITGEPDGPPTKTGVAVVDVVCGLHAGLATLAALSARDRLGCGQLIEVNLMTSALSLLANQGAAYLLAGSNPHRVGNAHPSVAPYEVYPTIDGDVVIAVGTDAQFAKLCGCLGLGGLSEDPEFATNRGRVRNRMALREIIAQALSQYRRDEVVQWLNRVGVPAGPVNSVAEAFDYAEQLGVDSVWEIGGSSYVRAPMHMSMTPPRPVLPPPSLDADGATIRAWLEASGASTEVGAGSMAVPH